MEVIYQLNEDDAVHFYLFARRRFGRLRTGYIYAFASICCLIGVLVLALGVLWTSKRAPLEIVVDGFMCLAFGAYLFWWPSTMNLRRSIRRQAKPNEGFLCQHRLTIDPEWLHESTHVNDSKVRWQSLQEITEDKGYIYFVMKTKIAHPVPKRAFLSTAAARQFQEQANLYRASAQQYGPDPPRDDAATWPPPPQTLRPE